MGGLHWEIRKILGLLQELESQIDGGEMGKVLSYLDGKRSRVEGTWTVPNGIRSRSDTRDKNRLSLPYLLPNLQKRLL